METDNWPLLDTYGSSFRSHVHVLVDFLRKTERMVALRRMDRRHEEVVRAKCIEFAERAKREPAISDLMSKIETLKITAKGQRDNQKVDQNLTRLGVN